MGEILTSLYFWTKALHIIAVITWMAGLFYMPRLFVYHVERAGTQGDSHEIFLTMEMKLLKMIINPASIAVWVFGLMLIFTPGVVDWSQIWPWSKAVAVLAMTWFHHWLGWRRRDFINGTNTLTGRQYRLMNEVPTVLLLIIVLSVVVKPF